MILFCLITFLYLQGVQEAIQTTVFIDTKSSEFLGKPVSIKADSGSLYFYDDAFKQITKVDENGKKLFSFGREGRGPGEFQGASGFWVFDDRYMIYDYNSFRFNIYDKDGEPYEDIAVNKNPVHPHGFPPAFSITTEALSPRQVLVPSRGRKGSLFALVDIKSDSVRFFGKAIGDYVASYNSREVEESYASGEIPAVFINLVALGAAQSGIYSYQQVTGILEKFDHSGGLIWAREVKAAAQDGMFKRFAAENRERVKSPGEATHMYVYANGIDVNDEGVAVLLNMPEGHPVTVVWVPADGSGSGMITYSGIEYDQLRPFSQAFAVSSFDSRIYFLNYDKGEIRKAMWPF